MVARVLALVAMLLLGAALDSGAHPGAHDDIARLTAALEEDPRNIDLLIERAYYHRENDDLAAALVDLDLARTLGSERAEIALKRGLTLAALARNEEAESELSDFLKENPRHATALASRAGVRARLDRGEEAIADYNAALELSDNVQLYVDRGRLQQKLGLVEDAARGYRHGLQRLDGTITLRTPLIRLETKRDRFDEALVLVDEGLERCSEKTGWYLRRSRVLTAARRNQEAELAREHALDEANRALAEGASAMGLYNRARVHLARGDKQAARRDLLAALDKSPNYEKARLLLHRLAPGQPAKEVQKARSAD